MDAPGLKRRLLEAGATLVGIAAMREGVCPEFRHLGTAVAIGLAGNLRENNLGRLAGLQKLATRLLREGGHRFFCIPPDSDRIKDTFASRLYPLFTHKMAATSAGLGWVGRNGLLINATYGPKLSLATVLTDAPLAVDPPVKESGCGDCRLCVEHCPSGAITGVSWSRSNPLPALVITGRCRSHKEGARQMNGKPNCGLCISICPYGRQSGQDRNNGSENIICMEATR